MRVRSPLPAFLRMLAHFDALDGDEEPETVAPRYELLYPRDSIDPEIVDLVDLFDRRLTTAFLFGA